MEGDEILSEHLPETINKSVEINNHNDTSIFKALEHFVINYLNSLEYKNSKLVDVFSSYTDWASIQTAFKRSMINAVVKFTKGNQNKAAELLHCDPRFFWPF